ncbi:uncharacterized protein [Musca autumnalis]|uniref:uncharacterized protein n=1 Tax=Musca autumnalis TaxID=221902 RepID=UPI003CEE4FAE
MESASDIFPVVVMPESDDDMMSDGEVEKEMLLTKIDEAVATPNQSAPGPSTGKEPTNPQPTTTSSHSVVASRSHPSPSTRLTCRLCPSSHPLYRCLKFKRMSQPKRLRFVVSHGYCTNCLQSNHKTSSCRAARNCKHCAEFHHILLHGRERMHNEPQRTNAAGRNPHSSSSARPFVEPPVTRAIPPLPISRLVTLAPTAVVRLCFRNGNMLVRALIDPCSGVSRICESLVSHLNWPMSLVDGVRYCDIMVTSCYDVSQRQYITAQVAKLSCGRTPALSIPRRLRIPLADYSWQILIFFKSSAVAIVLGPEVYAKIIIPSRIMAQPGLPTAQLTSFGWVISGAVHP